MQGRFSDAKYSFIHSDCLKSAVFCFADGKYPERNGNALLCTSPARLDHLCWGSCDAPHRMESEERRSLCARMLCFSALKTHFKDILIRRKLNFVHQKRAHELFFSGWIRRVHHSVSNHHRIWHASSILRGCVNVGFSEFNTSLIVWANSL